MSEAKPPASLVRKLWSTFPVLLVLLSSLGFYSAQMIHGRMLRLGESSWEEYRLLRIEQKEPACDPNAAFVPAAQQEEKPKTEEDELLDDLLDDDLLDDDAGAAGGAAAAADGDGAAGAGDEDLLDDLLGEEDTDQDAARIAFEAARTNCQKKWARLENTRARMTPGVERYVAIERAVEAAVAYGVEHLKHLLVLLLMFCGATATWLRRHIALRPAGTRLDDRVSEGAQLIANVLLFYSSYAYLAVQESAGATGEPTSLQIFFMLGFGVMGAMNVFHLARPPSDIEPGGKLGGAFMAVPLYAVMSVIAGIYFIGAEDHASGMAIYIGALVGHPQLYLQVGLFVWLGMLLKESHIGPMFFDMIRPWRFPPALLVFVVVIAAAVPTAYSGASGIFVIAVGALIYQELRRAGARRQLALAASAMSGSMGVVLSPCLLVAVVGALNYKEVSTGQLYEQGIKVFALSAGLFLLACIIDTVVRKQSFRFAPVREAAPVTGRAFLSLLPYLLIGALVLVFYIQVLEQGINEHTAAAILPVALLVMLVWDRRRAKKLAAATDVQAPPEAAPTPAKPKLGWFRSVSNATEETGANTGALLVLMGLSACLGGVIQRSDLMGLVPESFGSVWLTMLLLVFVLVIVGMIMDPYGAVILITATVAGVAYRNGIDPVHFWMVVLTAFELGYLTPPVALNHLLTRQVVGDTSHEAEPEEQTSFWNRHERILLPVSVMGVRFLIIAFIPLLFY